MFLHFPKIFKKVVFLIILFGFGNSSKVFSNETDINIENISIKDKVGQLFFSIIYSDVLQDFSSDFLEKTHVGNIVFFNWANKLDSKEEVISLTLDIKEKIFKLTHIKPFIALDQEGGKWSRLKNGFSSFPSNSELVKFDKPYVYEVGRITAEELTSVGVNLNFSPVVDVCLNPISWLFPRTFGSDPLLVTSYANAIIDGMHEGGLLVTLKHFPGHGDTTVNSHYNCPMVNKDISSLFQCELIPFISLKEKADFIMTSHIFFPKLDNENIATFSKKILTDLLKNRLGYSGIILCDSLAMKAATPNQENIEMAIKGLTEAAIKAFNAGCDMMMLSKLEWAAFKTSPKEDLYIIERVMGNFLDAVLSGKISPERVDESLSKILKVKKQIK